MLNYSIVKNKFGGCTNLGVALKEANPSTFSRFCPIFLCNSSFKILTKIISSRIKPVLQPLFLRTKVVSCNILYNIILVQEAMQSRKEEGEDGMFIKLDMANVFDRVHSFLFLVMENLGFSNEFTSWNKACIGSPWITLIINGRLSSFFIASIGLCEGCPLSPLLYIIMAEALSSNL